MAQVTFTNLMPKQAEELVSWFVNSGEQDFYDYCKMHGVRVTMSNAIETYADGQVRCDAEGNPIVVMEQYDDEVLDEDDDLDEE